MKILSVILLLAALAMAFLAMIFGTRFAALLNKGHNQSLIQNKDDLRLFSSRNLDRNE